MVKARNDVKKCLGSSRVWLCTASMFSQGIWKIITLYQNIAEAAWGKYFSIRFTQNLFKLKILFTRMKCDLVYFRMSLWREYIFIFKFFGMIKCTPPLLSLDACIFVTSSYRNSKRNHTSLSWSWWQSERRQFVMATSLLVLVVVLPLTLAGTITDSYGNEAYDNGTISWGSVPSGIPYKTTNNYDEGSLKYLFAFVRGFINTIQPNAFPFSK